MKTILSLLAALCLCSCASTGTIALSPAQAQAIAVPVVTAGLELALRNNPKYIPAATTFGPEIAALDFTDLSAAGIDAAVGALAVKNNIDPVLASAIETALNSGVGAYLASLGEATLTGDPNAVVVLQALGNSISTAATWAAANPKP